MAQDGATIIRRFVDEVITQGKIDSPAQYVSENVVESVPLPRCSAYALITLPRPRKSSRCYRSKPRLYRSIACRTQCLVRPKQLALGFRMATMHSM